MRILVNQQELSVTLEDERTVGDVVEQLRNWLATSGMRISRLAMNATDISDSERSQWETRPLDDIDELSIETRPPIDRDPDALLTLIEYLELLARALKSADSDSLRDVLGEYRYVASALEGVLRATGQPGELLAPIESITAAVIDTTGETVPSGDDLEVLKADAERNVDTALSGVQSRLSEVIRPEEELQVTAGLLSRTLPEVAEVAVLLQQGRDEEAMRRIVRFTDLAGKYVRLSNDGEMEQLHEPLNELVDAFDNKDTVLIGDLLEYEVVPRLENSVARVIRESEQ